MTQEMMIMAAILVAVILLTFIGILSRYRKCKGIRVLVRSRGIGNVYKRQKQDHHNLKGLAEDKNETEGQVNKVTIDSLLKKDMARYKKENFYE